MAEEKKIMSSVVKVAMPIVLGAAILYWMYRDFDFGSIKEVMLHEMDWTWMLLSMPFGALAQMFRGWRWRQTLEPVGEHPRTMTCINSIFMSYAASLVVPRIGEFTRCGVLRQYDGVSCPKSLGTVVTERAIDSLLVLAITAIVLMRWGPWAGIHAALGGVLVCLLAKARADQYLIYGLGNLLSLASLLLLKAWGKEETRKDALRSIGFALMTALLMQLGRALVAMVLGNGLGVSLGFFTTGVITDLFTVVVVWIARRLDGIFEDQIHYLLRIQREPQKG
jgi:uncharacterized protein (TIRG00374 family)